MELIRTSDWPNAKFANNFRILQNSGGVFVIEFGKYDNFTKEMTIVSQVSIEVDTLESLSTSLCDIIDTTIKNQE